MSRDAVLMDFSEAPDEPVAVSDRHLPLRGAAAVALLVGDSLLLGAVLGVSILLRQWMSRWFPIDISSSMVIGLILAVLSLLLGYAAAGLYPGYGKGKVERLRSRILITLYGFGAMILFDYLAQDGRWSRGILLTAALLSVVVMPVWDALAIQLMVWRRIWGERTLVAGTERHRRRIAALLRANPDLGWIPCAESEIEVARVWRDPSITVVVVVPPSGSDGTGLGAEDFPFRQVILVPEAGGLQTYWVRVLALGSSMAWQVERNLLMRGNCIVKWFCDIVGAALLLALFLPVIVLAALAIRLVSPGPFFFAQDRIGRHGTPFRMWKLRTMVVGADKELDQVISSDPLASANWESAMKIERDPRIVPVVGTLLRRLSLDELPQFWNVLCGEMSLVGPRPLPDYHRRRLSVQANHLREQVLPGITGLWQISGRSDTGLEEQERLDVYYVRNWSLWLDLYILSRTLSAVLDGKGAR